MYTRTADTKTADRIYDPYLGLYIKKLLPDPGIPILRKIADKIWTPIYTVSGSEKRLADALRQNHISNYYPRICSIISNRKYENKPFFPGVVFAALTAEDRKIMNENFLVREIPEIRNSETEEHIFADICFMTMAEHISRFYPFTFEKEFRCPQLAAWKVTPMTIDGFGDCRFVSNEEENITQIYFNFKTIAKIIKFNLTLYQFRSLLVSKVL